MLTTPCQNLPMKVIEAPTWWQRVETHRRAAETRTSAHLDRRARGVHHPVEDFLWEYYPLRAGRFATWHPGFDTAGSPIGLALPTVPAAIAWWEERARAPWYVVDDDVLAVGPEFLEHRARGIRHLARLLAAIQDRTPTFGCLGWHEWAMVYKEKTRHSLPLRLGADATNAMVESAHIRCTHFDAYRFFTPEAVDLNTVKPTWEDVVENEQPGCIHVSMDLLRACLQLGPLVSGELLIACYDLALAARSVDMAASPYDCSSLGLDPIRIETPQGKAAYINAQRDLAERARPLRAELLAVVTPAASHLEVSS